MGVRMDENMAEDMEKACSMWFQRIQSIGARTMFRLREHCGSMAGACEASEKVLCALLDARQFYAYKAAKYSIKPQEYKAQVDAQGIAYTMWGEETYPARLACIPDPPYGIFVKGRLPTEEQASVAIVGARACSEYGRQVAKYFAGELARAGVQVISGMARGIDSVSQAACLAAGGSTYAVLGNGVDICYPAELKELYQHIIQQGGVISSYAPATPPLAANFPPRNRIISGLADVVLVVEARRKSGTLITVDMALEQGKEVGVIPGRITDSLSEGCHALIKQGAPVIVDAEQLLEMLGHIGRIKASSVLDTTRGGCVSDVKQSGKVLHRGKAEQSLDAAGTGRALQKVPEDAYLRALLEVLSERPSDYWSPEEIYKSMLERGEHVAFQRMQEGLVDLELLGLCKSDKNYYIIR